MTFNIYEIYYFFSTHLFDVIKRLHNVFKPTLITIALQDPLCTVEPTKHILDAFAIEDQVRIKFIMGLV